MAGVIPNETACLRQAQAPVAELVEARRWNEESLDM